MKTKIGILAVLAAGLFLASCSAPEVKLNLDSLKMDSIMKAEAAKIVDTVTTDSVKTIPEVK